MEAVIVGLSLLTLCGGCVLLGIGLERRYGRRRHGR